MRAKGKRPGLMEVALLTRREWSYKEGAATRLERDKEERKYKDIKSFGQRSLLYSV
jgi:hypothetical protein